MGKEIVRCVLVDGEIRESPTTLRRQSGGVGGCVAVAPLSHDPVNLVGQMYTGQHPVHHQGPHTNLTGFAGCGTVEKYATGTSLP